MERVARNLVRSGASRTPASLCSWTGPLKRSTDRCGHRAGDELLRQLASLMRQAVASPTTLARLGGDEFRPAAARLRSGAGPAGRGRPARPDSCLPLQLADQVFDVGISIGIAAVTADAANAAELLSAADWRAIGQGDGEGTIRCYQARMPRSSPPRRAAVPERARDGAASRCLRAGQPAAHAADRRRGRDPRQEVLLRMRGDDGTLVCPTPSCRLRSATACCRRSTAG